MPTTERYDCGRRLYNKDIMKKIMCGKHRRVITVLYGGTCGNPVEYLVEYVAWGYQFLDEICRRKPEDEMETRFVSYLIIGCTRASLRRTG